MSLCVYVCVCLRALGLFTAGLSLPLALMHYSCLGPDTGASHQRFHCNGLCVCGVYMFASLFVNLFFFTEMCVLVCVLAAL